MTAGDTGPNSKNRRTGLNMTPRFFAAPKADSRPGQARILSVADLNRLVAGMLKERFGDVWVTGEVSNLKSYPSGHLYLVLKDDAAQIDAVVFRGSAAKLRFELENGLQIIGHGRLDLYEPRGRYQLILDHLEPSGLGSLQKAFEQLKHRLAAEGLFDETRKRPLPVLPRTVGIVTSPVGAAIHDMLRTFRTHRARMKVLICPVAVQGREAAGQVAEAVEVLSGVEDVDVIIVGRGGGSLEDLWCFNEEIVARALARSRVPVVTGIGHETDFTIADFVADFRAATPTAAAVRVAQGWEELEDRLTDLALRLREAIERELLERERRFEELSRHRAFELIRRVLADEQHRVERAAVRAGAAASELVRLRLSGLNRLRERLAVQSPVARLERSRRRLEKLTTGLVRPVELRLQERTLRLREASARLDALSPLASLARGYAVLRTPAGAIVNRIAQLAPGDRIEALVSDGRADCEVRSTRPGTRTGESPGRNEA